MIRHIVRSSLPITLGKKKKKLLLQPLLSIIELMHEIIMEFKAIIQLMNMNICLFFLLRLDCLEKWILLPPKNIQLKNG